MRRVPTALGVASLVWCVGGSARSAPPTVPPPTKPESSASEPPPSEHAERAAQLTIEKRYAEAAQAYGDAFGASRNPVYLYGRAMSLRRAGTCEAAIGVFEAFIATGPPASDIEAAQGQIEECEALIAEQEPPATAPRPIAEPPPPLPPRGVANPSRAVPPPVPWYYDGLGFGLTLSGAVATATGGVLLGVAFGVANDNPAGESERDHADRVTRVQNTFIAGVSITAVGAALLVGGIVRNALVARKRERALAQGLTWRF